MVCIRSRAAAALAAVLVPAGVLAGAAPAWAADVFIQVNPDTVQAGYLVGLKASCRVNTQPATVESPAFGTATVHPQAGFLTATASVPEATRAGTYRVRLSCPDGKSATTRLVVIAGDLPRRGPATGFGGTANDHPGALLLGGGLATTAAGIALGILALRRRAAPPARRPAPGRTAR